VINSGKATAAILAEAFVSRGDAYRLRENDIDRALADYDQAIRLKPDFALAFASRGFVYLFARRRLDQAVADFNEAIRTDPASANVFYYRGVAWSGKGLWDRAIDDFSEAIRLRPTFSASHTATEARPNRRTETRRAAPPTLLKLSASAGRVRIALAPPAAGDRVSLWSRVVVGTDQSPDPRRRGCPACGASCSGTSTGRPGVPQSHRKRERERRAMQAFAVVNAPT